MTRSILPFKALLASFSAL